MSFVIPHSMIKASAGSGKTHALVTRLIALLVAEVPPERLVAMTFTRAAAGEIFDELVTRLAKAAASPAGAETENRVLQAKFHLPTLPPAEFGQRLRLVVEAMHRMTVGTLDSFFAAMVRAFPLELGISPEFVILDEHAVVVEQERILRRLLAAPATGTDTQAQTAFREAFKRATFGQEKKTVYDTLAAFIATGRRLYTQVPEAEAWGDPNRIWPDGQPWQIQTPEALAAAATELATELESIGTNKLTEKQREKLLQMADTLGRMGPETQLSREPRETLRIFALSLEAIKTAAEPEIEGFKRLPFSPGLRQCLGILVEHGLACLLASRLENTRGLFLVLQRFQEEYEQQVLRTGRVTFEDLTYLLTRDTDLHLGLLSSGADERLYVDYRLDSAYDHWALDEFQDTSRRQWHAIANLADEVLQDTSRARSFFLVGDVKQAIYGWRGGDYRLMTEIAAHYPQLEIDALDISYRSGPDVIGAVNAVFDRIAHEAQLPEHVRKAWDEHWHSHRPSPKTEELAGCAALVEIEKEELVPNLARLLQIIKPWERGKSAAVLVRSNDFGLAVAAGLRDLDVPAVWEGSSTIAGHPLAALLLALLRYLEHPGDSLAGGFVRMTPAAALLPKDGREHLELLERLHNDGFTPLLTAWLETLRRTAGLAVDAPEIRTFLTAARTYDETGRRNCLEFCDYIQSFTAKDLAPASRVQVMTIHASKGLGFDLVLLPFTGYEQGLTSLATDVMLTGIAPDASGAPAIQWLIDQPGFPAVADPVLHSGLIQQMEHGAFEELCTLYVAMTRAKQGLYLFLPPPPKTSTCLRTLDLVRRGLISNETPPAAPLAGDSPFNLLALRGSFTWYTKPDPEKETKPDSGRQPVPDEFVALQSPGEKTHFPRRRPSQEEIRPVTAASVFTSPDSSRREFGIALHALFRELEWPDTEPLGNVIRRWRSPGEFSAATAAAVEAEFRSAMETPEFLARLERPRTPQTELWRERSFDIILDSAWVTGVFDRVTVDRDAAGRPCRASLLDFKSDRVRNDEELRKAVRSYAPQIRLYRAALAKLLELQPAAISAHLLFTTPRRAVSCE